jgi:hypothetical protein
MKKLLFIFCLFVSITAYAQDTLSLRNGQQMIVNVVELTASQVKYTLSDTQKASVNSIAITDVAQIKFKEGNTRTFTETDWKLAETVSKEGLETMSSSQLFDKGKADAQRYYEGYKPAATGTFITTFFVGGIIGLIPAISCSSSRPKDKHLNAPSPTLIANQDYYNGYVKEAKKIKSRKVWMNYGIAVGIDVAVGIILSTHH